MMPKVSLSDGRTVVWDRRAIIDTLVKESQMATTEHGIKGCPPEIAREVAMRVEGVILCMGLASGTVSSHLVRELVCHELRANGMDTWADMCGRVGMSVHDACKIDMGDGFNARDNANQLNPPEKAHKDKADYITKAQNMALFPSHVRKLHMDGHIHIHDLEYFRTRIFCQDHDLRWLFYYGLVPSGNPATSAVAGPAKNAEVAILHAVKMLGAAQTNCAGGQGFYNFLTFLAPYLEGKRYAQIKQLMQMLVYELMQMYVARGGQTVFSSLQLSPGVPKIWRDVAPVYAGFVWNRTRTDEYTVDGVPETYWKFEREVRLAFKALMEVMLEGDAQGKPFAFPKPEISIEPCFIDLDDRVKQYDEFHSRLPTYRDLYMMAAELAAKFGTPYFDNQMPEYRGAGEGISCFQCCAYSFAKTKDEDPEFESKMNFENGAHFSMGSNMVVSLNLPRAAYHVGGDLDDTIDGLKVLMEQCVDIFKIKRRVTRKIVESGRLPFLSQRPLDPHTGEPGSMLVDFDGLVYTIGIVGLDDMVKACTGARMHESLDSELAGVRAVIELQEHAAKLSADHGFEIALARTPAETTAQRFAVKDLFGRHSWIRDRAALCVQGDVEAATVLNESGETDLPVYYTNGTHVPPSADVNLVERINLEHKFFPILDGGNIMHIWLGEAWSNLEGVYDVIMQIAKNTQVGYFAFTKDFTTCNTCGRMESGLHDSCTYCSSDDVDHLSRITGYLSAVSGWNRGKLQELADRRRVTFPSLKTFTERGSHGGRTRP